MTLTFKTLCISAASVLALAACNSDSKDGLDASEGASIQKTSAPAAPGRAAELDLVSMPEDADTSDTAALAANKPYNAFLKTYVSDNGSGLHVVDYAGVMPADRKVLTNYIESLEAMKPSEMSNEEQMAFWFNLYNAKTIDVILQDYPVKSIKDIDRGPWDEKRVTVEGTAMSLDNIEHDTVRAKFKEPRVHYAFNCASIGCPNIKATAWEAATLDADLTQAAKDFIASDRGVSIDKRGGVDVSKIYKWYSEDFGDSEKALLTHLGKYASGAKKAAIDSASDVDGYNYDWSLNAK